MRAQRRDLHFAASYTLFAVLSTALNILTQMFALHLLRLSVQPELLAHRFDLELAMLMGTAVGLLFKYVMDKHFIFAFESEDVLHEGRTMLLYGLMGVFTTLEFWIVELLFNHFFSFAGARYVGACVGLGLGYWLKYRLDRRFVFVERRV